MPPSPHPPALLCTYSDVQDSANAADGASLAERVMDAASKTLGGIADPVVAGQRAAALRRTGAGDPFGQAAFPRAADAVATLGVQEGAALARALAVGEAASA